MLPGEIYSHEGKKLADHLLRTAAIAQKMAERSGIHLNREEREAIVLHDLVKAHPLFQKRLAGERIRFNHAVPSAILTFLRTGRLLCAEAVRRHHTALENLAEIKRFWGNCNYGEARKIFKRLPWWPGAATLAEALGVKISCWSDLLPGDELWEEMVFNRVDLYEPEGEGEETAPDWLKLRLLYSLLVAADRLEAMGGEIAYVPLKISKARVDEYISSLGGRKLAQWRNQVREEVVANASEIIKEPGVYTLTLPTGAGKTLTGLQIATEVAAKLKAAGIIYVLPFISLVEQNAAVARELFATVLEDHYLSFTSEKPGEEAEEQDAGRRFLAFYRYWQEPVIVTTLAKMWEVLFSPRANDTMSFHRLSRAIVLLDEPQSIPAACWEGFGKTLTLLSRELGTVFILMTATQPGIVAGRELTPVPVNFPAVRHEFHWLNRRLTLAEAADFLVAKGFLAGDSLIVLNTRQAALRMYLEIKKRGADPLFLSAWLTPVHREEIFRVLKEREEKKEPRCLVSTQVVEAGIDLDFAMVFRDLGPMDSIVQVAGRCNRNAGQERGQVYIAELVDENGRNYASYIYDSTLLNHTRHVLKERFDERDCGEIIKTYFRAVQTAVKNSDLWRNIREGRWGEYVDLYAEKRPDEVLLVVDGAAGGTGERLRELLAIVCSPPAPEDKNRLQTVERKRLAFREITRHAISVPKKYLEEWYQREGGMIYGREEPCIRELFPDLWLVQGEGIGRIYRRETGFIPLEIAALLEEESNGC